MMMATQKHIPLTLSVEVIFQEDGIGGLQGFFSQRHVGLLRGIFPFSGITFFAGSYKIHPGISTAARAGNDMVDGEFTPYAAVLTFEIITLEYVLPGKINALVGGVNISVEADDGRHRKALGHRMQPVSV